MHVERSHMPPHGGGGAAALGVQRPVEVPLDWIVPARFCMSQQCECLHDPPSTSTQRLRSGDAPIGLSLKALPEHGQRSEEHTSELQSLMRISYAAFRLKTK